MTEGVVGPDELDESLEAVNEEVRRLDRLVGDLLDLTRLEAHQFRVVREEVGLEALLEQAAGAFREKARAVDIDFETPIDGRSDGHHRRRPRPSDREQPPRQRLPVDAARRARSSWAA